MKPPAPRARLLRKADSLAPADGEIARANSSADSVSSPRLPKKLPGQFQRRCTPWVKAGGLKVNDAPVTDENMVQTKDFTADGVIKLSFGKKKHVLLKPV